MVAFSPARCCSQPRLCPRWRSLVPYTHVRSKISSATPSLEVPDWNSDVPDTSCSRILESVWNIYQTTHLACRDTMSTEGAAFGKHLDRSEAHTVHCKHRVRTRSSVHGIIQFLNFAYKILRARRSDLTLSLALPPTFTSQCRARKMLATRLNAIPLTPNMALWMPKSTISSRGS